MTAAILLLIPSAARAATVTDLAVVTAGYLGGEGDDRGNGVVIQSDKTIVIGGGFSALPQADAAHALLNAGPAAEGALVRLSPDGQQIRSITRLGAVVDDLDLDPIDDAIVAVGDFGLAKLSSDGSTVLWQKPLADLTDPDADLAGGDAALFGNGRRVATGADGTVAAQFHEWYFIFDREGTEKSRRLIAREDKNKDANPHGVGGYSHRVEDVAIDSDHRLVFLAGFSQRAPDFQSAYLVAFSYAETGEDGRDRKVWSDYNWWNTAAQDTGLTADTRGVRVSMGRDGRLYFTGYADGGNNIFTRHPGDLSLKADNVAIDRFNNGAGAGPGKFAYFMAADPATGDPHAGQFQYSSAGVNDARSFTIYAVTGDETGSVLIGGQSADAMPDRSELKINSTPVGQRVPDENSFMRLSPDLAERRVVACWTGTESPGTSRITALDSAYGLTAVIGETQGKVVTVAPLDGTKNGATDLFYSVWGETATSFLPGDVDCSRRIDVADLIDILNILAGGPPNDNGCDPLNGDLNGNDRLDLGDAVGVLRMAARGGTD
jgi:hypothetical protein